MRRWILLCLVAVLLFQSSKVSAATRTEIYKDGKKINTVQDPIEINSSTFVPMRNLFEAFNAKVDWNKNEQSIIAQKANTFIKIKVGSKEAFINGKKVILATAPSLKNGTVFVPLRFVSESFHSNVGWLNVNEKKFITISSQAADAFKITHIRDGDTFSGIYETGRNKGKTDVIRLIGVDTPETVKENTPIQYYGPEASAYTKKVLSNKTVSIVKDQSKDVYGRTLAYVFLPDGQFLNAQLVGQGFAKALSIEPNTKWKHFFSAVEKEALIAKIGLWNQNKTEDTVNILNSLHIDPNIQINEEQLLRLLIVILFPETKAIFYAENFYELSQDEQFRETVKIAIQKGIIATDTIVHYDQPLTKSKMIEIITGAYNFNHNMIDKIDRLVNGFSLSSNTKYISASAVIELLQRLGVVKDKVTSTSESALKKWFGT